MKKAFKIALILSLIIAVSMGGYFVYRLFGAVDLDILPIGVCPINRQT